MVVNLELEKLAVLTPRKKPPLSSKMVGGPQNRSGQCGEKEMLPTSLLLGTEARLVSLLASSPITVLNKLIHKYDT
jgi:hypothetical protein